MAKRKHTFDQNRPVRLVILGLAALGLFIAELLYGTNVRLLNPMGLIADEQFKLILFSTALLLLIGVPALFLFYYFAWKYRETNDKAAYEPQARHGRTFIVMIWAVPCAFALALALVMWPATHRLEPNDPIASSAKPLTIQVVALRWKWLFIYPEQHIATVNFVQIPTDTPVQFELTADEAPMSSFWVPQLGGQLYAMTGHENRLNLIAGKPGDYAGSSAEINGAGFAGMKFTVRAGTKAAFDKWAHDTRLSPDVLDAGSYLTLLQPSEDNAAAYYALADQDLYAKVLMKYMGTHEHGGQEQARIGSQTQ